MAYTCSVWALSVSSEFPWSQTNKITMNDINRVLRYKKKTGHKRAKTAWEEDQTLPDATLCSEGLRETTIKTDLSSRIRVQGFNKDMLFWIEIFRRILKSIYLLIISRSNTLSNDVTEGMNFFWSWQRKKIISNIDVSKRNQLCDSEYRHIASFCSLSRIIWTNARSRMLVWGVFL